jgi:GT2 family glycosyltransferase
MTGSVHYDAFRADPFAYLTATKWWMKRKRVRARGQFAPLLSRSPRAYRLWVLREESGRPQQRLPDSSFAAVALIDINGMDNPSALAITRQSLHAEGLPQWTVGSTETPTLADAINQIDWSDNPWLLLVKPGDCIATGAMAAYGTVAANTTACVVYADDDLLVNGRRTAPYFKPDWNAELFRYCDYLSGACMINASRADLEAVAGRDDWLDGLVARMAGLAVPVHLRSMLHHRASRPSPHIPVSTIRIEQDLPPISIIIPTRNRVDLLRTCLDGVAATDYEKLEIIVVDNDSDDPETLSYLAALDPARHQVLRHRGPFNYSAINNHAVHHAQGRLLCLLNNDIETKDPHWLAVMARQALRPDVGAVGARLLYPDGRIQHAGVVIGVGNAAAHAHRFLRPDEAGYFHRHSLPQFTSAVTAACLVVERDKFMAVGGLNERDFAVAFNDVDFCLRLNQRGWQSLYEPRATLIHHESVSRGLDRDPVGAARFAGELAALKRLWKTDEIYDPFHHPQLSRASEQFAVAL